MKNRQQEKARYEAGSNTIRKIPENYCLIAFDEIGEPVFNVDAATSHYRERLIRAWNHWVKSGSSSKEVLAAIVSRELDLFERLVESYAVKFIADHTNDAVVTEASLEKAFKFCVIPASPIMYDPIKRRIEAIRATQNTI